MQLSAPGLAGHKGPTWLRGSPPIVSPVRFKKTRLFCRLFPLSATVLHYALSQEECRIKPGQQWRHKKTSTKAEWPNPTELPPLDLQCPSSPLPAPPLQPSPRPPARPRMLQDSDLFTHTSHLGFSGRLGGATGTGSVRLNYLHIPVGRDSSVFLETDQKTGFGKLGS